MNTTPDPKEETPRNSTTRITSNSKGTFSFEVEEIKKFGEAFATGVILGIVKFSVRVTAVILILSLIGNYFGWSTDDSDYNGWHRSNMRIHVDARTGVNYVTGLGGGTCVRIDTNGAPIITP